MFLCRCIRAVAPALFAATLLLAPVAARAATFTVTKTADTADGACDADCSLREAIVAANSTLGADAIEFDLPVGSCSAAGVCSIPVATSLPVVTEAVTVDGTTQPRYGTAPDNVCATATAPSYLRVQVQAAESATMFDLQSAQPSRVRGLSLVGSGLSGYVVGLHSVAAHRVDCNHIGVNGEGTAKVLTYYGVCIGCNAVSGGGIVGTNGDGVDDLAERNVFAASMGVNQNADSNFRISGNYFGLAADGTTPLSTAYGLYVRQSASNNVYGTNGDGLSDDLERNVFGDCDTCIDLFAAPSASGNVVAGNWIGLDAEGAPSASTVGIRLKDSNPPTRIAGNRIGATTTAITILNNAASFASGSTDNCIAGNGTGLLHSGTQNVAFPSNWWGDASGPSGDEAGSGDAVDATAGGTLDVTPWLTAAPASCLTPIFRDTFESGGTLNWSVTSPPPG